MKRFLRTNHKCAMGLVVLSYIGPGSLVADLPKGLHGSSRFHVL